MVTMYRSLFTKRFIMALVVAGAAACSMFGYGPAHAETGAQMQPAVTINYTQKGINPKRVVEMLISEVSKVNPNAKYDVVGYETTPKNVHWPVSARVSEVRDMLVAGGVQKENTYVLVKPTDTSYQTIEIFVRN
jgi:ABC-type glycerol-3-phosphate transport system substrate-binding protein